MGRNGDDAKANACFSQMSTIWDTVVRRWRVCCAEAWWDSDRRGARGHCGDDHQNMEQRRRLTCIVHMGRPGALPKNGVGKGSSPGSRQEAPVMAGQDMFDS